MNKTLPLFYSLSERYEDIFPLSVCNHIQKTVEQIDELYVVCNCAIDKDRLRSKIKFDGNINIIDDNEAWEICGYQGTEYEKLRLDNWMRQQLIKINADKITGRDLILVFDVDAVAITKTKFLVGDQFKLFYAYEKYFHKANDIIKEYFGDIDVSYDFVVEKTIFNSQILQGLRDFLGDSILQYSSHRHIWYDITPDEYNMLAGSDWPSDLKKWDLLPEFVKFEIMQAVMPSLRPTLWHRKWSEYQIYGYYAMLHHPDKVLLTACKTQNGPWGDGTADIFINRASDHNSIEAFKYIYYKYTE